MWRVMLRVVASVTGVAWLYLLTGCIVGVSENLHDRRQLAIGLSVTLFVCVIIGTSVFSAFRPKAPLGVLLLLASLAPAYLFGRMLFSHLIFFGWRYLDFL